MNRQHFEQHIRQTYGALPEYPWMQYPTHAVYRHESNRKWFAVVMELPAEKLGLPAGGRVNVVNLKCDPLLIGSLWGHEGIHKGYHMNKKYWLTLRLDGSIAPDQIRWLLEMSFQLTAPKKG